MNFTTDADGDITPFFIAERGDCSFVRKVRNMENIGVSVAIIIDSDEEDIDEVVMSDDGTGGGLRIPAMLIGKTDGKKLIDFLRRSSQEEIDQTALLAEFVMEKPDNRVEYDLWFTSSNDRALDFISDFREYDEKFGSKVLFTPHYVFWKCPFCESQYLENDCFGNGKYCAVEPSNENIRGREIILEDIRQKCIYNRAYESEKTRVIWWDYMTHVHQNCYSVINEDCSRTAHTKLGIDFEQTMECVYGSFSSNDWAAATTNNTLIEEEIEYWKTYGTGIYPSIVINNRTYRGQLESLAVFNALCAGFANPPHMCANLLGSNQPDFMSIDDGVRPAVIVGIVLVLILLNVVIVYCYRRHAKREMQGEMQMQIESAVSQYFALSQKDSAAKPYVK